MKTSNANKYPPFLLGIQILNYVTVFGSLLAAGIFIFGSQGLVSEFSYGIEPANRYAAGISYLAIAVLAGCVLYKFRKRDKYAPELFVIMLVLSHLAEQAVDYFSAYDTPFYVYVLAYSLEAVAVAYLLLSHKVRAYFDGEK